MTKRKFYLLSFTFGLPITVIGLLSALILMIVGFKPQKYGYCLHFKVGSNWGGASLGVVFITDKTPNISTKNHEHGHSIQNCYWGFLMPFVICLPSVIRYWYREYLHRVKGVAYSSMPDYDSVWYEGQATKLGTDLIKRLGEN